MHRNPHPPLFILVLLSSFASVTAVLFTPALPAITQTLGLSPTQAKLTVSLFIVGYALGNLPWGPFSNRFGRKASLYCGILLTLFGTFLILLVERYQFPWLLFTGRFLTAIGSSAGIKVALTMIGDTSSQEAASKKLSMVMLSFAIAPGIAVAIGGLLTTHFGWESCFYFLGAYSIALLLLSLFLPETCKELDLQALNVQRIATGYLAKLKNRVIILTALIMGCGTVFIYLFASDAPFIGINKIGLTPDQYGLMNLVPPVGMVLGSFVASRLAGRKEPIFSILLAIVILLVASAGMLIFFLLDITTIWSLFIPMIFMSFAIAILAPNAMSLALSHAKNKSNASAMMNFVNIGFAAGVLFINESFQLHTTYMMPLTFTILTILMIFLRQRLARVLQSKS